MAQWSKDKVAQLLSARMKAISAHNKRLGYKTGVEDLSSKMAPIVIALMSDARRREVSRAIAELENDPNALGHKLKERRNVLKRMAEVLWKFSEK